MEYRFRLLPLALAATVVLLGIHLGNLWNAFEAPIAAARAEGAPVQPAAAPAASAPPATTPAASAPAAAPTGGAAPPGEPAAKPAPAADKAQAVDPTSMSPAELDMLQKLAERRAELDRRAGELAQQEVLLQATEKRIDEKIARLTTLEKDIGGIVDQQQQQEDQRIKSLVKIYETMKPHDAARIFEQLDMPVLLPVVEHMKERIAAPILAAMDPAKARAVTLALAERKDREKPKPPAAAPTN